MMKIAFYILLASPKGTPDGCLTMSSSSLLDGYWHRAKGEMFCSGAVIYKTPHLVGSKLWLQ